MTSLEELLHDIDGFYFQLQTSGPFPYPQVLKAVKAYATLLETHTPEKIEALLKGEAWIAPNEPTDEMLARGLLAHCTEAMKYRPKNWGTEGASETPEVIMQWGRELINSDYTKAVYQAMRQSSGTD